MKVLTTKQLGVLLGYDCENGYDRDVYDKMVKHMKTIPYFHIDDLNTIKESMFNLKYYFVVKMVKGKVAAITKIVIDIDPYISYVSVHEKFRNKGLCKEMLNKAFEFLKNKKYKQIDISVYSEMGEHYLNPVYEKLVKIYGFNK